MNEANLTDIPRALRRDCKRVPKFPSGFCREEVDLRASGFRHEIVRGLLALLAILAIGVFLIAL